MKSDRTFECPSCALDVEAGATECPYCGYEFPAPQRGRSPVAWLMILLLGIPLLWLLLRLFG